MIKPKLIIAIDFDDTLYDAVKLFLDFNRKRSDVRYEDITTSEVHRPLGITPEEEASRWEFFFNSPEFSEQVPAESLRAELADLKDRYRIVIMTARDRQWQDQVVRWTGEHLPDIFEEIIFTDSPECGKRAKVSICEEKAISILVDDDADRIAACADSSVIGIVFDRPWNRHLQNVRRITSFSELC